MAEEVTQETQTNNIEEQMRAMSEQLKNLQSEVETVKSERDTYKTELKSMEENLAKELDKLNQPQTQETQSEANIVENKVDGKKVYDNLMELRESQKKEIEKSKEEKEREKIFEENRKLRFEMGVKQLVEKEPYLKSYIEEGIKENRFKSIENIEAVLSPTLRKALEYDYKKSEEYKNSGRDPMERYSQIEEATDNEIKQERKKKFQEQWAKILGMKKA